MDAIQADNPGGQDGITTPTKGNAVSNPLQSPWVTSGGGFVVGLFITLGVGDLFHSTKYAFALTAFGFVSCLICVIALATTDLQTLKLRSDRSLPIGVWACSVFAVLAFAIGLIGTYMFFDDFLRHPALPATASYMEQSLGASAPGDAIHPHLLVNGADTPLSKAPASVEVERDAKLEVTVPDLSAALDKQVESELQRANRINAALKGQLQDVLKGPQSPQP